MAKRKDRIMKIAQSCDSRKCKEMHKDDIIKNFSETITTAHEINLTKKTRTCLDCGKVTKF